jgi:diguanylate cyclase (GGDEF)-like protein
MPQALSPQADADTIPSSAWTTELASPESARLRSLLSGGIFDLLRLPQGLERAFRLSYREKATSTVHYSVYGLMALYLMVVLPVAALVDDPQKALWLRYAVYPIGAVLLVIWACTRLERLKAATETALVLGLFACLVGTLYASTALGDSLLGRIATYETIYVLLVGFLLLMLPSAKALCSALAAFFISALMASLTGVALSWLTFLYFWIPLGLCAVCGYLLEYAARRQFLQGLVQEMAALANDGDDLASVMELALGRLCRHTGWVAGRVFWRDAGQRAVTHYEPELDGDFLRCIDRMWLSETAPALTDRVIQTGAPAWRPCLAGEGGLPPALASKAPRSRMAFPIMLGAQVVAVLEFFSQHQEGPKERLLALLDTVGQQLGRTFERKCHQHDLEERALHDALTGLPNRAYLFDRLQAAMAKAKRSPDYRFCMLFLDVDRFKWINDSLGHLNGDRLLIEISRRLLKGVRASDLVSRLGGDEFAILIEDIDDEPQAIAAVQRIQQQLLQPITVGGQNIHVGSSIGVAIHKPHYDEPEELLRDADIAMYHAKQNGRGIYALFVDEMREQAVGRLHREEALRHALEAGQFVLYYQPIVCMSSGRVASFEALVRWQHPEQGLVPPDSFIPLAEETGLIVPLTEWALMEACRQLRLWQQPPHTETVSISVNLCARYLTQPDMPDRVLAIVEAAGIRAGSLHLEITETQIIGNADICQQNIHRLREAEIAVYIDDFGTGYSSLNYLASFKAHALKIDKSFTRQLGEGGKDAHIVRAITSLSQHLGLCVIAEGVETAEQWRCLQALGCHFAQGFLLSKAVEAQAAAQLIGHSFCVGEKQSVIAEAEGRSVVPA